MPTDILETARAYLVQSLQGKQNEYETKHPWRKDWEFAVLHSLRVEAYALKILAREKHALSEHEIRLLRLAAILHDLGRVEKRENHARLGAEIAGQWLQNIHLEVFTQEDVEKVVGMIADHSNKEQPETDYSAAVLKDADTLDEIGIMSVFMAANWLENKTAFFFYDLRQRLIEVELPFCDKKMTILNTAGAKAILREKKAFVESCIAQLTDELQADSASEQSLRGLANGSRGKPG
jgi:HD superfamily phosphodiesterase